MKLRKKKATTKTTTKTKTRSRPKPEIKELQLDELKAIIERARTSTLTEEDVDKLGAAVDTLAFLTQELEAYALLVYWLPRSEWYTTPSACPCLTGMSRAGGTSSVRMWSAMEQPTTHRDHSRNRWWPCIGGADIRPDLAPASAAPPAYAPRGDPPRGGPPGSAGCRMCRGCAHAARRPSPSTPRPREPSRTARGPPLVAAGPRDLQDPAHREHRVVRLLRVDEGEPHRLSLAKKAVALSSESRAPS